MACTTTTGDRNSGIQVVGKINGSVNFFSAEPPPPPSIEICYPRDVKFIERGTTLDEIERKFDEGVPRVALVALSGLGKTQIAIEHAYRTRERSANKWVFWVHASNLARFEESYRNIANRVKIPGSQDPQANIFQLVENWLCDGRNKWLLILDNLNNNDLLLRPPVVGNGQAINSAKALYRYLPYCEKCSILITTTNQGPTKILQVESYNRIDLGPMEDHEALALFQSKLGNSDTKHDDIAELAKALEYIPLVISQAAAFILQRGPRFSVKEYLEQFKRSMKEKIWLLTYDMDPLRQNPHAEKSIFVTWKLSFDQIKGLRRTATELLSLMSFFDRQGIPRALLQLEDREKLHCFDSNEEFDIAMLQQFGFISVNADGTLWMHQLVQLAMQHWLETEDKSTEQWRRKFIKNLKNAFPTGEYKNWATCRSLFPHAKLASEQQPDDRSSLKQWARLMYNAAWYAKEICNYEEAEQLAVKSRDATETVRGKEHADTLRCIENVASIHLSRGKWRAANELYQQVRETRKKQDIEYPDTLISMENNHENDIMEAAKALHL